MQDPIIPEEFIVQNNGTSYILPEYTVVPGVGIQKTEESQIISFVRGSKLGGEEVDPHDGILHEALLSMQIHDLQYKQSLVPSRETAIVITRLEEALMWMQKRSQRRKQEGTQGTYQK